MLTSSRTVTFFFWPEANEHCVFLTNFFRNIQLKLKVHGLPVHATTLVHRMWLKHIVLCVLMQLLLLKGSENIVLE